jgi:hypothetical protein
MKTFALLFIFTAATATAQTNHGSVRFTNIYGSVVAGEVLRVDATKFQIKQAGGIIAPIKFSEVPTNIQVQLGYDAAAAAALAKEEAEQRIVRAKREAEAALIAWQNTPQPKPDKGGFTIQTKATNHEGVYWSVSYVLTVRNPTDTDFKRDYRINFLDADGHIVDYTMEYNFITPARSTNIAKDMVPMSQSNGIKFQSVEVKASTRK